MINFRILGVVVAVGLILILFAGIVYLRNAKIPTNITADNLNPIPQMTPTTTTKSNTSAFPTDDVLPVN